MSASFNLVSLPFLAQMEVLENLGLSDLLTFSTLSRKTLDLVKYCRVKVNTLFWKFADNKKHSIVLDDDFMIIINPMLAVLIPTAPFDIFIIGDLKIKVFRTETCWNIVESNRPAAFLLDVMDQITKMILNFCTVEKFDLETALEMDVIDLFIWKYTRTLDYFLYPTNKYSGPELTFVLREIKVKTLELPEDLDNFKYKGQLTMDTLLMTSGSWLTEELLKTMKCKEVTIDRNFSMAKCNKLMKLWREGYFPDLEKFTVEQHYPNHSRLLDGINTIPWKAENRPEHFKYLNMSQGKDFRRSDGTMATCSTLGHFDLVIWHPHFSTNN